MFELIKKDINRYYRLEGDCPVQQLSVKDKIRIIISAHGLHVIASYRLAFYLDTLWSQNILWKILLLPLKIISVFWEQISVFMYGTMISREAVIGEGFYIAHIGGIVIGPAKIGENVSVTHNVTLGVGKIGKERGIPTIGDNVWITTGVVLFGKIDIGSGVAMMPGTVISKNIVSRALVAGNPGRVIQRDYDNSSLLFGSSAETELQDGIGCKE